MKRVSDKLPRGHAYAHFRTDGYTFHFDFPEKHLPWINELIKLAAEKFAEDESGARPETQEELRK